MRIQFCSRNSLLATRQIACTNIYKISLQPTFDSCHLLLNIPGTLLITYFGLSLLFLIVWGRVITATSALDCTLFGISLGYVLKSLNSSKKIHAKKRTQHIIVLLSEYFCTAFKASMHCVSFKDIGYLTTIFIFNFQNQQNSFTTQRSVFATY